MRIQNNSSLRIIMFPWRIHSSVGYAALHPRQVRAPLQGAVGDAPAGRDDILKLPIQLRITNYELRIQTSGMLQKENL